MEDIKTFNSLVDRYNIVIPHIQRDYVQGSNKHNEKRDRFVVALIKHLCNGEPLHLDFVYGSCDENKEDVYYPLDGQQRLTTLFLLKWFLEVRTNRRNNKKVLSYQSRRSSEQFCAKLSIDTFDVSFHGKKPSKYIEEEKVWFVKDWLLDPTIKAMVEMLDVLHEKLKEHSEKQLNDMLNNFDMITFDHLDLKKYNFTDTLYIKMNERGKHLTDFENWKASLIGLLEKKNKEDKKRFEQSIEHEWTDLLWTYSLQQWDVLTSKLTDKEKENAPYPAIDNSFMNLLLYIHRILFFATATNSKIKASDFSDTLSSREQIFSDENNLHLLFDFLDLWSNIKKGIGIESFFSNLFGNEGVTLWREGVTNLFNECILNAKAMEVKPQILFYAVSQYCIRRKCYYVTDELISFVRICRNLLEAEYQLDFGYVHCETSVSVTEWSRYKSAIDAIIENIDKDKLWLEGVTGLKGVEHEKDKHINYTQHKDFVRKWEDDPMLKGCLLAILPALELEDNTIEKIDEAFNAFFNKANDTEKVQLLVAFGYRGFEVGYCDEYTRKRLFFGAKDRWDVIFRRDNENVKEPFSKYVSAYKACPNINDLIKKECGQVQWNTFIYYMLRYDTFVQGNEKTHYFAVKGDLDALDIINIRFSPSPISGYHCDSFAYVVCKDVDSSIQRVKCWSAGKNNRSSVELLYTLDGDLFSELHSTKDGWILRKNDTNNIEYLEDLYERLKNKDIKLSGEENERIIRLEDNGNKDLIELGKEVTKICIKWIDETFNKG